jgi:hypothetical protein
VQVVHLGLLQYADELVEGHEVHHGVFGGLDLVVGTDARDEL